MSKHPRGHQRPCNFFLTLKETWVDLHLHVGTVFDNLTVAAVSSNQENHALSAFLQTGLVLHLTRSWLSLVADMTHGERQYEVNVKQLMIRMFHDVA